jgi:WXG100 family type VII secretion target
MAYEVRVSTGDVAAKAAAVGREAQEIEARLAHLTAQMGELASSWTGAAAGSFQGLYGEWERTARQVKASLDQIALSLRGAGQEYDALEQRLTRAFS